MTSVMLPLVRRQISRFSFRIDGTQSAERRRRSDKRSFWQERKAFNGATEMRRRLVFPESRDEKRTRAGQRDRRREGNCGSGIRASDARDSALLSVMLSCFVVVLGVGEIDGIGRWHRRSEPSRHEWYSVFSLRESIVEGDATFVALRFQTQRVESLRV